MATFRSSQLGEAERTLNQEFQILISLVCESVSLFKNYDQKRIAVSIGYSKNSGRSGVWAYVVPLRYPGGAALRAGSRRGVRGTFHYHSPAITKKHPDALYLMSFMVPRFFRLSPHERLETVVHELYHLHPSMRGDLRTFHGAHRHHGPTPHAYNRRVRELATEALAQSPWLMQHPLITAGEDYFSQHRTHRLAIPRRVFVPDCSVDLASGTSRESPHSTPHSTREKQNARMRFPILSRLLGFAVSKLGVLSLLFAAALTAPSQVWARSLESADASDLLQSPASSAEKVGHVSAHEKLKFVKFSDSGKWILVSVPGGATGWIKSSALLNAPVAPNAASATSSSRPHGATTPGLDAKPQQVSEKKSSKARSQDPEPDESPRAKKANSEDSLELEASAVGDEEAEGDSDKVIAKGGTGEFGDAILEQLNAKSPLEKLNRELDKFYSLKHSKFFETPTKFAVRYGIIEPGDELIILNKSKSGQWLKVRLKLTGEEGWYPKIWIKVVREERMGRWGDGTFTLGLGMGSGGTGFGLGPAFYYNLKPHGLLGGPRDRLELGLFLDYFFGESFANATFSASAKYLRYGAGLRYVGVTDTGSMGGAIEGGLVATSSMVSFSGSTTDVLASTGIRPGATTAGAMVAFAGFLASNEHLQWTAGAKIFICSPTSVYFYIGPTLRF